MYQVENQDPLDVLYKLSPTSMSMCSFLVGLGWGRISSCHWMVVYDNNDSIIFVVTENVNLANAQNEVY